MSKTLFELDQLEESRDAVKEALALVPEGSQSSQLESFLATLELRLSLTKEQRAALDESDRLNGEAIDLLHDGNVDAAVELLQRAVEAYERNEGALSNLTRCLVEMRELDDAERYAQKRADLFPDSTGGWVNLGYVYELKGDYLKAVECYEQALAIDPDDELANRGLDVAKPRLMASFLPNVSCVSVSGSMEDGFTDEDLAKIMGALNTASSRSEHDDGRDDEPSSS